MRNDGLRILKAASSSIASSSGYDSTHKYMQGYDLDLTRRTAVLMRQSRKGADRFNPESRLRQEGLVRTALEIRADQDPLMILECDEGSGVSGQKKIYERPKLLELWQAINDGTVGSVIVAREDRLFRDRLLTQATQFVQACFDHSVILIVAGRRCYDFRIRDDQKSFIDKMEQAFDYLETHVKYMHQMLQQKLARGEWVGGGLVAPYVLDRTAIAAAREQRKLVKEFGSSEEDELFISRAYRPVIYESWHPLALDLFEKFKLFDYSRSRMTRYIEERKYVFPLPKAEELHHYLFKVQMGIVPGYGYTFSDGSRLLHWLSNLMHIGFASAGKDEEQNRIYIEGAFDAAIPLDLFAPCYESITGFTLDGHPSTIVPNRSRYTRKRPQRANTIPARLFQSTDKHITFRADYDTSRGNTHYAAYHSRAREATIDGDELSYVESSRLWSLPTIPFDAAVVSRLSDLAAHDKELAKRIEKYYAELTANKESEKKSILNEIANLKAYIDHYDRRLNNPARPLTAAQEARTLEAQAKAEEDLEKAQAAFARYERSQPGEFIPAFYRILGEAPGEFWDLDIDRQRRMLSLLIDEIQVTNISPHLYKLLLKWKDPVAQRWDCAVVFKRQAVRSKLAGVSDWSATEEEILGQLYPAADKLDLYKSLPTKTGDSIKARATMRNIRRNERMPAKCSIIHRALCYDDWMQACAALAVDPDSEEGSDVLRMLNYHARLTDKEGTITAFWWVLPIMEMNVIEESWAYRVPPKPYRA